MCFIKCATYVTNKDFTEDFSTFIRTEQRRSNVVTSARNQPICRKYNINIDSFNGTGINLRNRTQRITSVFMENNHFCLIWKSQNISFNQVKENDLKPNFKVLDNVIPDKHVKSFIKYS